MGPQRTWSSKSFLADAFVTAMLIICGIILNLKAFSVLLNFEKKSVGWEEGSTSVSDVRNAAIFSPQPFTIDTGEKFGALLFRLALTRGLVLSNDFETLRFFNLFSELLH